jgi:hypothetical protein
MSIPLDRHIPGALDSELCCPMGILVFFEGPGVGIDLDGIFAGIGYENFHYFTPGRYFSFFFSGLLPFSIGLPSFIRIPSPLL